VGRALVAAAGVLAEDVPRPGLSHIASMQRGRDRRVRGRLAFEVGGGNVGRLHLLEDLIAL